MHDKVTNDLAEALLGADIILTDGWPKDEEALEKFMPYQLSLEKLKACNKGCLVNPCPPINRNHGVTTEVMDSPYFIGYKIKESLLYMQKAILTELMVE